MSYDVAPPAPPPAPPGPPTTFPGHTKRSRAERRRTARKTAHALGLAVLDGGADTLLVPVPGPLRLGLQELHPYFALKFPNLVVFAAWALAVGMDEIARVVRERTKVPESSIIEVPTAAEVLAHG